VGRELLLEVRARRVGGHDWELHDELDLDRKLGDDLRDHQ
jgi:hypothetical protein